MKNKDEDGRRIILSLVHSHHECVRGRRVKGGDGGTGVKEDALGHAVVGLDAQEVL